MTKSRILSRLEVVSGILDTAQKTNGASLGHDTDVWNGYHDEHDLLNKQLADMRDEEFERVMQYHVDNGDDVIVALDW